MDLQELIKTLGYESAALPAADAIEVWKSWYQGKVAGFHEYSLYNRGRHLHCERATLNMAKVAAEYWGNLIWNRDCSINLNDENADQLVNAVLAANDFTRKFTQLLEQTFALGTGAIVAYDDAERGARLEFVDAERIIPLLWRGDEVHACAFASREQMGGATRLYLMLHEKDTYGGYIIRNMYFVEDKDGNLTQVAAPASVQDEYRTDEKRFALLRPGIYNNLNHTSPMGVSVYANAIDTLKSIDLAYDGARVSMAIGRPRIGVTSNMFAVDGVSGESRPMFDAQDIAIYDLGSSDEGDVKVTDLTTQYRANEFEKSLEIQLRVYSQLVGLGENAFRWVGGEYKTATEVVAANSSMLRAMVKHQDAVRETIKTVVRAILDILDINKDIDIDVIFDDSVTSDRTREAAEAWLWVTAGKYPFWRYLKQYHGYDEADARAIQAEAEGAMPVYSPEPEE